MVYKDPHSVPVWIVDLGTGHVLYDCIFADTVSGLVVYYAGLYEADRGEDTAFEPYVEHGVNGFRRRKITKFTAFDVVDCYWNVIDKCRP